MVRTLKTFAADRIAQAFIMTASVAPVNDRRANHRQGGMN
jgi:hypothetical protein